MNEIELSEVIKLNDDAKKREDEFFKKKHEELELIFDIINAYHKFDNLKEGKMICPDCKSIASWSVSSFNGHRHFKCTHCSSEIME